MSLLDQFLPQEEGDRRFLGNTIQALGMSLLQGDSRAPFATVGQNLALLQRSQSGQMSRSALKQVLLMKGFSPEMAEQLSTNETAAKLAIQDQTQKQQMAAYKDDGGGVPFPDVGTPGGGARATPPAPAGPAEGASLNGRPPSVGGAPLSEGPGADVQTKFIEGLKQGGLTNPYGLAAMAAYGKHESGYNPANVNRTWADPSESGQQGQSGGVLSWRAERLDRMKKATQNADDPVVAQATFALREDPALTEALNRAKSPEEANGLMARAWRFAGHDRPGGEYAARLATTRAYAERFAGAGQQRPVQVASSAGMLPTSALPVDSNQPGFTPGANNVTTQFRPTGGPGAPPPTGVAETEDQVQAMERATGMLPPDPRADAPAPGSAEAGFVVPPAATAAMQKEIGKPPAPVNEQLGAPTQRAQAIANINYWGKQLRKSGLFTDDNMAKAMAKEAEIQMGINAKYLDEPEQIKLLRAAGVTDPAKIQEIVVGGMPGQGKTANEQDYQSYRQEKIEKGEVPLGRQERALELSRAGVAPVQRTEDIKRAESVTGYLDTVAKEIPKTYRFAADLDTVSRVIARTPTGTGTPTKAMLDGIARELRITDGSLKTKADVINAAINRMAPGMREPGSGTMSDVDLRGFMQALPGLSQTPEGNQLIINTLRKASDLNRQRAKIAAEWQSGDKDASTARREMALLDEKSLFQSPEERKLIEMHLGPVPGDATPTQPETPTRKGWRILSVE